MVLGYTVIVQEVYWAGVPDCLFKEHRRWKSDKAKDGYVEDSVENRLSVTKKIGI